MIDLIHAGTQKHMMGVVRGVMALTLLTFLTVHAEWFPEMSLTEGEWTSALSHFSPSSSYTTCRGEHTSGPGGNTRFITLYKDHPMTFVLVGKVLPPTFYPSTFYPPIAYPHLSPTHYSASSPITVPYPHHSYS